jgi:hypothetical protein
MLRRIKRKNKKRELS